MKLHPHFEISNANSVELNKLSKYIFTINLKCKVMCTIAATVATYSCAVCDRGGGEKLLRRGVERDGGGSEGFFV